MKALSVILSLWFSLSTFAQGVLTFANSPTTLLSANGVPMPVSGEQQFIFAVFLAPSTTVTAINETVSFLDPAFQIVEGYNTNQSATPGRLVTRSRMPTSYTPGSTVDFIVRGWSANAGGTWAEALATWNNGVPLAPMFIGSSTIGNDFFLAGDTPSSSLFGLSSSQVRGFDMGFVPEPTVGSALILAGAVFVRWRRRRDNTNAKSFSLPSRRTSN